MPSTLTDIIIVMAAAVVVTLIFGRLRLPTLVGLFVAGVLIGPHAFGLIKSPESVEELAEIGVIFLLFTLGLELSFRRMARLARVLLIAGPLQVILTGAIGMGVGFAFGLTTAESVVLGMLVALSSTAVVLKTLTERAEIDTPVGRNVLGILIFQDILVVPIMLVLPLLGGQEPDISMSAPVLVAVAVGMVALVIVLAKWVVPRVLYEAARARSADLFLMVVVAICFAVAALSAWLGLSLALGAFLAGLIISESEYGHHSLGLVMPFRNLLVSFFFVSVGMLLNPAFLAGHWWMVLLGAIGLMLVKTITGTIAVRAVRYPLRVAFCSGLALSQIGEFSFVLAAVAVSSSLLPEDLRQGFLAVAVLTMAVTP
ncbi:MAG: cation:proton antiporter, partial [Thermoleophilia bacterium]|nr:cation:proton antiporter [Thermoleophilia bacterium]